MQKMVMNAGNQLINRSALKLCSFVLIVLLGCFSLSVKAIDNPDAPDYLGGFLDRAQSHELDLQQIPHTTQGYIEAYADYERFLNEELDVAFNRLMTQLNDEVQFALRNSQQQWLSYRDKEFDFIAMNWTRNNFGSASVISRGDYRATIIKSRIELLLRYLQNY